MEYLEDRHLLAGISVELATTDGNLIMDNGQLVLELAPQATTTANVNVTAEPPVSLAGFQFNFENTASRLLLNNWVPDPMWESFDDQLDSSTDNYLVSGFLIPPNTIALSNSPSVFVGAMELTAPNVVGDFMLTLDSIGPFATGFTAGLSDDASVDDPGDLIIRTFDPNSPVTGDDSFVVDEDSTGNLLDVLANDTDPNGRPFTVTEVSDFSAGGNATIEADNRLRYTPAADFFGIETFNYVVDNGTDTPALGIVQVEVRPSNDPPIAAPDSLSTPEDIPLIIQPEVDLFVNDMDLDGDSFTVVQTTAPAHGQLTDQGNGRFVYGPAADYFGTDQFTYTISDGNQATATATVTITVSPLPDPPQAIPEMFALAEDSTLQISIVSDLLGNDTDVDGDPLALLSFDMPLDGSLVDNQDGTLGFTPPLNFFGSTSFTYTITDNTGSTSDATVTLTVNPVNDAVVGNDDAVTALEDTPFVIDVEEALLANDVDVDGDDISLLNFAQPANGTIVDNQDGTLTYTPSANFIGNDTFTYTASDGNNGTGQANVQITVLENDDPPVALDDQFTILEDETIVLDIATDLLANDSDEEGEPLVLTNFTQPANGVLTEGPGGTLEYVPSAEFSGSDSFQYTISDGNSTTQASVLFTVEFVNDAPIANVDSFNVDEDAQLQLTLTQLTSNDTDVEGDPITIVSQTPPPNGTLELVNNTLTYTPGADFNGVDQFTYMISDGRGGTDRGVVNVTVAAVNDPPTAVDDDFLTLDEDTNVAFTVESLLLNDSDIDGDDVTLAGLPTALNGSVSLVPAGFLYTPNADYNGGDTITYMITDGNGATDSAQVSVVVRPVNDPPVANDDAVTVYEDNSVVIDIDTDLLGNDSDPDGNFLVFVENTMPVNGQLIDNQNGTLTYFPVPNAHGVEAFEYSIQDLSGTRSTASVTITILPVNDPPVAADDGPISVTEDVPLVIDPIANFLVNDSDLDGDFLGILEVSAVDHGTLERQPNGDFLYSPDLNFHGDDEFIYTLTDGNGGISMAEVTLIIHPVNDPPEPSDITFDTEVDTPFIIDIESDLLGFDVDGDPLSFIATSNPANGRVVRDAGILRYTPSEGFVGIDQFLYSVTDGEISAMATIRIAVGQTNTDPIARDDVGFTLPEDGSFDFDIDADLLSNDSDVDDDPLNIIEISNVANGAATLENDGTISYQPLPDFDGTDSFTYTISDGRGGTSTATVQFSVFAVNDPPTANDDTATATTGLPAMLDPLANDTILPDFGETLSIIAVGPTDQGGAVQISPDATYLGYEPADGFLGQETFTYTISDGNGTTDSAVFTVTVVENQPPNAVDDLATTAPNASVSIDVLANDTDPENQSLSLVNVSTPANGTASIDGALINYEPAFEFQGTDTFTYTIRDDRGNTSSATVTVHVVLSNGAPVATDDQYQQQQGTTLEVNSAAGLLANDLNPGLGPTVQTGPQHGAVQVAANGSFTYTPNEIFFGTDSFTYSIENDGATDQATVTVQIAATTPWRNPLNALDVNGDGRVEPQDILIIINRLNNEGAITGLPFPDPGDPEPPPYLDPTGDNNMFPDDALKIINAINRGEAEPEGAGEGEGVSSSADETGQDGYFARLGASLFAPSEINPLRATETGRTGYDEAIHRQQQQPAAAAEARLTAFAERRNEEPHESLRTNDGTRLSDTKESHWDPEEALLELYDTQRTPGESILRFLEELRSRRLE